MKEIDFVESEVDPILDKISEKGIQSLTERERKILEQARKNGALTSNAGRPECPSRNFPAYDSAIFAPGNAGYLD